MNLFLLGIIAAVLSLAGCRGETETDKPIAAVRQEAGQLSVDDLKARARACQNSIIEKLKKLEPIREKFSRIALNEKIEDQARGMKKDITDLNTEIDALKERLLVYLDALEAKGESIKEYLEPQPES